MSKLNEKKRIRRLNKLIKMGNYENALKTANRILKLYPNNFEIYDKKAECLLMLDKDDETANPYKDFLKHSNKKENDFSLTINGLASVEKYRDALELINENLKINPNSETLIINKPFILFLAGKEDESIEFIDKNSKSSPHWRKLLTVKAECYLEIKENEKALEAIEEILKYDDQYHNILGHKVKALFNLNRNYESEQLLDYMIENDIDKVWAFTMKGFQLLAREENSKALECMENALELDPEYDQAKFGEDCALSELSKSDKTSDSYCDNTDERLTFAEDYNLNNPMLVGSGMRFEEGKIGIRGVKTKFHTFQSIPKGKSSMEIKDKSSEALFNEYFFLASLSLDPSEKKEYYMKIIDLFHELHDEDYFEEFEGNFWGYFETRNFMLALGKYAELILNEGKRDEAIELFRYMLKLNPNDNQSVRDLIIPSLLLVGELDDAHDLMEEYNSKSPNILFNRLLWAIKTNEDIKILKNMYNKANKINKYIVPLLLGEKKLPNEIPDFFSFDDYNGAVYYIYNSLNAWKEDKNALNTLKALKNDYNLYDDF
ncbi:MAG: hypothetical protein LBT10_02835 [Methanobrevibacter sp.]|jgi:tetratricopeptide (TPR) repeat protein|nr:hypothetical protein [Methanobrevibacter sp.]